MRVAPEEDAVPDEHCTDVAEFTGYQFKPPAGLTDDANFGRIDPDLRAAVQTGDPIEILTRAAFESALVMTGQSRRPGPEDSYALALSDLAVSGRAAYHAFCAIDPTAADIEARCQQRVTAAGYSIDARVVADAADGAVQRSYNALWALRGARRRDDLGWIMVSAEDDPPHRPVNVPASPYPQYDLSFNVATSYGTTIPVETRFIIAATDPPSPARNDEVPLRCPPEPMMHLPPFDQVLLYVHGMDSRLEEANDLVPALLSQPDIGKPATGYAVVAMDLPSSGYASMIDHNDITPLPDRRSGSGPDPV